MARNRTLSSSEVDSVLKGINRVLKNRDVQQPIQVTFANAESALCWKRQCETLPDGTVSCQWVQVPC